MHSGLGTSDSGWMFRQLTELGQALAAFNQDLGAQMGDVTLVTLSEFGRRVAQNGSGGLDHGHGNVSLVMGGGVRGGKVHGPEREFRYVSDPPFEHDVRMRVPDVRKARDLLGFEATTSLDEMLDEVIPWIRDEVEAGRL